MHCLRSIAALVLACFTLGCASSKPVAPSLPGQEFVASDGLRLRYTSLAKKGQGVNPSVQGTGLLFIHGWCGSREHFAGAMERFAQTHPVAALDLAGHGESESGREVWSFEGLASDVAGVLDQLGWEDAILIGHSLGGPLAVIAANAKPDKVSGVIAVNALHDVARRPDRASLEAALPLIKSDFRAYSQAVIEASVPRDRRDLRKRLSVDFEGQDLRVATAILELYPDFDMAATLAACPVPVRAINGSDKTSRQDLNRRFDPDFEAVSYTHLTLPTIYSV